jgi:hypothetical protein
MKKKFFVLCLILLVLSISSSAPRNGSAYIPDLPDYMTELLEDHPDFYSFSQDKKDLFIRIYTVYHY